MTTKKARSNTAPNPPSHIAYQVRERDGGKGFWTRIGVAWPHGDDCGFSIQLESVPLDGRITLRVATDKQD